MSVMSANLIVMPAGPALVAELAPKDPAGDRLRRCLRALLDSRAAGEIHLVGSRDPRWETGVPGSFGAWGAPHVTVGAGRHLPELVQRYVLADHAARVTDTRERLGTPDREVLTLVAVDGSAGLTPRAPLALLDTAGHADRWCRTVLGGEEPAAGMDAASLRNAGVLEPDLWLELAALTPRQARLHDADTTHGVGRYVAGWEI